jgi:hypothetical protein
VRVDGNQQISPTSYSGFFGTPHQINHAHLNLRSSKILVNPKPAKDFCYTQRIWENDLNLECSAFWRTVLGNSQFSLSSLSSSAGIHGCPAMRFGFTASTAFHTFILRSPHHRSAFMEVRQRTSEVYVLQQFHLFFVRAFCSHCSRFDLASAWRSPLMAVPSGR